MIPMNVDLALNSAKDYLVCVCCDQSFNPFADDLDSIELSIEALKDEIVIAKSLQNNSRLFDDC
jgi:hypothetical protein